MKFKLLLSLLIAAMLVCSFAFVASAASEVTEIGTADELAALMADSTAWAGNYKLTADIDLTGKAQNPIGNTSTKFTGTFDGDNHEITGVSITGSEQGTGFFGYISGATIKNLTVGGSVESSKSRAGGIVACVTGVSTVENCTSNVSVYGKGGATGGVVGCYLAAANSKVSVINCVNNGSVTGNGGIVGYTVNAKAFDLEIIGCVNNGNVTGTSDSTGVGGVFGYGAGTAESGDNPILIEKCANYGTVSPDTSSGKYVGGILGRVVNGDKTDYNLKYAFSVTVRNCYNKGDIIGKTGGGIVGYVRPPKADTGTCVFENVMSADSTNRAIIGAVGSGSSTTRVTYTFTNAYTVGGTTIMQSTSPAYYTFAKTNVCLADATEAELAALSEAEGWVMGENGPELMSFHTHTSVVVAVEGGHRTECGICGDESTFGTVEEHISVDGVCTVCGAITACAHESTTEQLVNASTCITKGSVNVVCNVCGATVETVELDIDSANHGGEQTYEWTVNAESGAYEIICAGCGVAMHTSTSLPTVYLANYGTTVGDDANDGLTPETAVASITEAVNRIKNMGGTVKIVFGYALTAADVVLPEWNGTITFTSNEF
ncbi:MAG: hypothetical protein IKY12_05690, partial [Clostridia bacterium]|nr:hypothetical protein [Clostridia bacterium]